MKIDVWIWELSIDGDASSYHTYPTRKEAEADILLYVRENWENVFDGKPIPGNVGDAIQMYFAAQDGVEWYSITCRAMNIPDAPMPDNAVEMTRRELDLCRYALARISYSGAADALGLTGVRAQEMVNTVMDKLK